MKKCRFCGKICCDSCLSVYDLIRKEKLSDSEETEFTCYICSDCDDNGIKAQVQITGDEERVPPSWTVRSTDGISYYYHLPTHHSMKLNPLYSYSIEKLGEEEEVVPYEFRKTYTETGELYYQNLETGEFVWNLNNPK